MSELQGLAALIPGLSLSLVDERVAPPFSMEYRSPRGLADLVQAITESPRLSTPIVARARNGDLGICLAVQADESERERFLGFASLCRSDRGRHIEGLARGLDAGFRRVARDLGVAKRGGRPGGLHAVVALDLETPAFSGQDREFLENPEVRKPVTALVTHTIIQWAREHPNEARALLTRG